MCSKCGKKVAKQGIRQGDLITLPFVLKKWRCVVPLCKGGCTVRDYGNDPMYYWHRKNIREGRGKHGDWWSGGWFDATNHFYMCSRHRVQWSRITTALQHRFTPEYFLSMIVSNGSTKQRG